MARGLILAARHPRPRISSRVCYGRTDVPLAEAPAQSATELRASIPEPIDRIITSPLSRASLVARQVAEQTGAPLHTDDRLMEMDFGEWENRPWSSIPRGELDGWAADTLGYRIPGGESVGDMLTRVRRAWTTLASAESTTLLLTHAGPIRCLLHIAGKVPISEALQAGVAYNAVVRFTAF